MPAKNKKEMSLTVAEMYGTEYFSGLRKEKNCKYAVLISSVVY
jgi:hypothetical protein